MKEPKHPYDCPHCYCQIYPPERIPIHIELCKRGMIRRTIK